MLDNEMKLVTRQDMYSKARQIVKDEGVHDFCEQEDEECSATVIDEYSKSYPRVVLSGNKITSARCTCRYSYENGDFLCPHALALALYAVSPERVAQKARQALVREGRFFLDSFSHMPAKQRDLRLEITLHRMGGRIGASLRVGATRMYVIKALHEFVSDYLTGRQILLGKGFLLESGARGFTQEDEHLLQIIDEAALSQEQTDPKIVLLNDYQTKRLFKALPKRPYLFQFTGAPPVEMWGVAQTLPDMHFTLSKAEHGYLFTGFLEAPVVALTADCEYIFCNEVVCHVPRGIRPAVRALAGRSQQIECAFEPEDAVAVLSSVIPAFETFARVTVEQEILSDVITAPMEARVELDLSGRNVLARVGFAYGDIVVEPFGVEQKQPNGILRRDFRSENAVTDLLLQYGFRIRETEILLSGDDAIYQFLATGIEELNKYAQVFADQSLTRIRPRTLPLRGQMRVGSRGIEFSLLLEDVEAANTPEILAALRERKRYVRLLDGSFLSLKAREHWDDLAREVLDNGVMTGECIEMESYRTVYLNSLLDAAGLEIERDDAMRKMSSITDERSDVPAPIDGLRSYQLRGFNWLRQLYEMSLGGILADDMGLGKTVQTLAAIKHAKIMEGPETSLVVAPTSLVYNWEKEVKKFAPDLSVLVLEGTSDMRASQIEQAGSVDILIASYAQVRRDIEHIRQRKYRFCVLDEAQNIKNFQSVGAIAVKRISAKARFALTGTPMENHIGELWSVFDYILPGYLGSRSYFMSRFGEGLQNSELSVKIRPFLMRRIKKDVLSELPDKIEDRVLVELGEYQQKVYRAMLQRYKSELVEPSSGTEFSRNRMKILAAITRLRQVCCHPSLFLDNYQGGSGKLDVLMDIVREGTREGRKMLVFSQFTSMLSIIRSALDDSGIRSYYLDGDVAPRERMRLCDRFNADSTPVFLISMKAGGTGLNLTGAEMVIHFDPWWNPAVEDQATDRAHRIGQVRKVHVLRLIARGTIEEKVADLQSYKKEIVDAIVKPGEVLPAQLGQQEILSLFD